MPTILKRKNHDGAGASAVAPSSSSSSPTSQTASDPTTSDVASPSASASMTAAASSPASLPSRPKPIDNEFHRRGEELFDQGDYGAAAFMLGEAVRKDTGNAHLYVRLAVAQTMCAPPQLDGALANLDTALRISPNDGQAWLNRGNVLERQGDLEPAEEAFERAAASLQGDLKQVAQQRLAFARARQPETGAASSSSQPVRQDASSSPVHRTASAAGSVDSDPNSASSSSSATSADADAPSEALTGDIRVPEEAPPPYSPPISQSIPSIAAATQRRPIEVLTQALKLRSQGSVLVYRPEKRRVLDLVFVHCVGKAVLDSLFLDRPVLPPTHPAWTNYHWSSNNDFEDAFMDSDAEMTAGYDGYHPGTASVVGYTRIYRQRQITSSQRRSLSVELPVKPPAEVGAIVQKLQVYQKVANLQYDPGPDSLKTFENVFSVASALYAEDGATLQVTAPGLANVVNSMEPYASAIYSNIGIGRDTFLHNMEVGIELNSILKKMGSDPRCTENIQAHPSIAALIILATRFLKFTTVQLSPSSPLFIPHSHPTYIEGLLRFAEAIEWPYLDEARRKIEGVYDKLVKTQGADVHRYLIDWLYGLVLPGKYFRHKIMGALVVACPSTRKLNYAPDFDSGLIVKGRSYWPKLSVLGRVLGGLEGGKSTCGWVGPAPVPSGGSSSQTVSWVKVAARDVRFPTPVEDVLRQNFLEEQGFSNDDAVRDPNAFARDFYDLDKWQPPKGTPPRRAAASSTKLKAVRLSKLKTQSSPQEHQATLDFEVGGRTCSLTLFCNPVFVHVPRCIGAAHPLHERRAARLLRSVVPACDLKRDGAALPGHGELLIIDATQSGEEALARAWCAETGRNAILRRAGTGCFTCAVEMALPKAGLGFNVLIWCL